MTLSPPDPAGAPDALRVLKHPVPVAVAFAAADGVCNTLEGPVHYRAGDALLTGVRGECWPVARAAFDASYESAPGALPGQYVKRLLEALALRLRAPARVQVGWQDDPLYGRPGDWLLRYADGTRGVLRSDVFRETYGPAPGETRWPPP